jgi:hypothetical protein
MGSVGLEASLPRPPWKETTPFTLICPRAASSAPVPQNNIQLPQYCQDCSHRIN